MRVPDRNAAPAIADFHNSVPPNFPIQVNESDATVTVEAGVSTRVLLDYLSDYMYGSQAFIKGSSYGPQSFLRLDRVQPVAPAALEACALVTLKPTTLLEQRLLTSSHVHRTSTNPRGWTLKAFSWYIDQSIGGAIATGTHGSSFQYGSMSSEHQVMQVITPKIKHVWPCTAAEYVLCLPSCWLDVATPTKVILLSKGWSHVTTLRSPSSDKVEALVNRSHLHPTLTNH